MGGAAHSELSGELLWTLFEFLDGRSLAAACCVSKLWSKTASHEDYWRAHCEAEWPSVATDTGKKMVQHLGSYQTFFSLRKQAQRSIIVPVRQCRRPTLGMSDLLFLFDVRHGDGTSIYSVVKGGEELSFDGSMCEYDDCTFQYTMDISPVFRGASTLHTKTSSEARNSGFVTKVTVEDGNGGGLLRPVYTKEEIRNFTISWAIMVNGKAQIAQLMHRTQGHEISIWPRRPQMKYSCLLPRQECCLSVENNDTSELCLWFRPLPRYGATSYKKCEVKYGLKTMTIRFLSCFGALLQEVHALRQLEQVFISNKCI